MVIDGIIRGWDTRDSLLSKKEEGKKKKRFELKLGKVFYVGCINRFGWFGRIISPVSHRSYAERMG